MTEFSCKELQLTSNPYNHILSNANVWSHDGQWIYYDVRSDAAGAVFDGNRIERVNVHSGEVEIVFTSKNDACVGVVTASPVENKVVFIHGPENPSEDWSYSFLHRYGVIVDADQPGKAMTMDARDITPPFTPGALRGGSHVHTFSPDGKWVAFTYEDRVLAQLGDVGEHDLNQRGVGVSVPASFLPGESVIVDRGHPRNHDGSHFSVLVTRTINHPRPGSDEIGRACEEGWIGRDGYLRSDGTRQQHAIAFQGEVVTKDGRKAYEVFVVDLPNDLTRAGDGPLEGTQTKRPAPPQGVVQRRLTFTTDRKFPGISGPRHWLRSAPDGTKIAFLMQDDNGIVQLWTVSPSSGDLSQLTHNQHDIASTFTWSSDGRSIAHMMDSSVCITDLQSGKTVRLTSKCEPEFAPRPEACVFSPDGKQVAYVRPVKSDGGRNLNQVFVCSTPDSSSRLDIEAPLR